MSSTILPTVSEALAWMEVGEPPQSVLAWKNARVKRLTPILSAVSAVIFGPISGFAAVAIWPGAQAWTLMGRLELFGAVAVVVGVADFLSTLRVLPWFSNMSMLHIRRVAIAGDKLHLEPATGHPYDYPLHRLGISKEPVADRWYTLSLNYGKVTATVFVPEAVQKAIVAARPPTT